MQRPENDLTGFVRGRVFIVVVDEAHLKPEAAFTVEPGGQSAVGVCEDQHVLRHAEGLDELDTEPSFEVSMDLGGRRRSNRDRRGLRGV